jgi:peroxiredoxin
MKSLYRNEFGARAAVLAAVFALAVGAQAHEGFHVGEVVSDFTLPGLDGAPVSLSDFAGDIIVVNWFATWCPGCNEEAASLEQDIWQVYREHGVTVLSIDLQEAAATVQAWVDAQGVTYHILLAPNWDIFALFPMAGGLPYNAVIDRDMVLRYGTTTYDREAITGTLDAILGFNPVADEAAAFGRVKALFR